MLTTIDHQEAKAATGGEGVTRAVSGDDGQPMAARLTTEQVWSRAAKASFAVLGHVTPAGEPRSSGVVYKTVGRRLYVAVATVSFHATAIVHPAGSLEVGSLSKELASLLPAERRASACIIEVIPQGAFLTYGLGVSLLKMRIPAAARARVPVTQEAGTR